MMRLEGDTLIESFWNICLLHDISSRDQLLREATRVHCTKQMLEKVGPSKSLLLEPEELFQLMKERVGERELGHFPGDRDLFYKLYHAGEKIDLLEYALHTLQQDRITGGIVVHSGIFERFHDMCDRNQYRSILIAEAEKYIRGLVESKVSKKSIVITLLTENYIIGKLFKTYFISNPNVKVIQGSIYQSLPMDEKFNAILAIPNFGMKLNEENESSIRESEGIAVNNLLPLLDDGGTMSVTFPARMMFQSGVISDWRKQTNENAPVQSIHSLPDGIMRPFTSVKTYQVDFGKFTCNEMVIGQLILEKSKMTVEREIKIYSDHFRQMDDWRIEVLLNEDDETLRSFQQAAIPKVRLRDVADIFRGKSVLKQDLKSGNIKVINISNLDDGEVILNQLETIEEEERKIKRYEILPDDLLITCRGTVNKLAVFPESDGLYIASANIIVIRFKSTILSHFAKIFLESPTGSYLLQSFQRGTTLVNLNPADVAEIEVPLLSKEQQLKRINQYLQEKQRYNSVIREATSRWEQVKNKLYGELY
jgi:hypothetical protein